MFIITAVVFLCGIVRQFCKTPPAQGNKHYLCYHLLPATGSVIWTQPMGLLPPSFLPPIWLSFSRYFSCMQFPGHIPVDKIKYNLCRCWPKFWMTALSGITKPHRCMLKRGYFMSQKMQDCFFFFLSFFFFWQSNFQTVMWTLWILKDSEGTSISLHKWDIRVHLLSSTLFTA